MRRAQNAYTHALKQHRLSQNISPVCSSFVLVIVSDMHLEPENEKKKTSEKRWFTHRLKYPDTTHTFSVFSDESLWIDLRPIYCRLTILLQDVFRTAVSERSAPCVKLTRPSQWSTQTRHRGFSAELQVLPAIVTFPQAFDRTGLTGGKPGDLSRISAFRWTKVSCLVWLKGIPLVLNKHEPFSLSLSFFVEVLFGVHQSFALLLLSSLWVKYGGHSSGFRTEYYWWRRGWLKLLG